MNLTERMKKYAENREHRLYERGQEDLIFTDLQATVRALEVARTQIIECEAYITEVRPHKGEWEDELQIGNEKALQLIEETLGKAGV